MDDKRNRQDYQNINILDYLLVLLRRRRFIITVTVGVTLLTAIVAFVIPKTYRAESKILVPTPNQNLSAQLLSQLSGSGLNLGIAAGMKTPNDLYMGLLKSRVVLDAVIDKFKLMELYDTRYREDARRYLLDQLKLMNERKSGIITVAVEDRSPARAADMANAFIEELRNLNKSLAVTEASQRRLFYEEQLKAVKTSLITAEESMKAFQENTGAVKIDDQGRAAIQGIAHVRAQIAAKEVQLRVMKTYATARNPDAQRLEEEIKGLREQLGRMPIVSTGRMPQLGTDHLRNLRELKFNEALYEMLLKQFEVAKLDEARDATVIQVIEQAAPPEKKVKPKRAQMVGIAFAVSLLFSILGAFFLQFLDRSKENPENKERLEQIRELAGFRGRRA